MAAGFNADYARFLDLLTRAFGGEPRLFTDAVGDMFRLKNTFGKLVRSPLPSGESRARLRDRRRAGAA